MTVSVIQKLSSSFTDSTLPVLYRDQIMNTGSLFLFDFLNSYCNPNADGAIAGGSTFNNLVNGGAAATVTGSVWSNLTGKAGLSNSGTSGSNIVNAGAGYDLSSTNHEFLHIVWIKLPSTGYNPAAYPGIATLAGSTGNANTSQWYFDAGSDGKTLRTCIGAGGSSPALQLSSGTDQGVVVQLAQHWKNTGLLEFYVNGALQGSTSTSVTTLQSGAGHNLALNGTFTGTFYRWYGEDLTTSGATAAAQVAADYTNNSGRFT